MTVALIALAGWLYTAERWGPRVMACVEQWVTAWADDRRELVDGRRTERLARQQAAHAEKRGREPIPQDLEAVIADESAQFARDELRAQIKEHYAECGDWQQVRRAVGVGEMPE